MAMVNTTQNVKIKGESMIASINISPADIEKLSNFRSGLRQYLNNSHLFCEIFELTDLQYIFLLTVKALEQSNQASHLNLKDRLQLIDSVLTKLIRRSVESDLLIASPKSGNNGPANYRLTTAGNNLIETLAAMHRKEFETFQRHFVKQCETHCDSPVCWKGSD